MSLTSRVRRSALAAPARTRSSALSVGLAVGTLLLALVPAAAAAGDPRGSAPTGPAQTGPVQERLSGAGRYVVILARPPAASLPGYDPATPAVTAYTRRLRAQQASVAAGVRAEPFYSYTTSLNGFAADLTGTQARRLARDPAVLAVVPDRVRRLDAAAVPAAPGATVRTSPGPAAPRADRGLVLGVVDSGVDSDHPAFASGPSPAPAGWTGTCASGADPDPGARYECAGSLVGGRHFVRGLGGAGVVAAADHLSPEDRIGHGTHVASTAVGAATTLTGSAGSRLGRVTGVAPGAALAAYKVCWRTAAVGLGCATSDVVAAVDRAVADGVDVLAMSVAGTASDPFDPVQVALLHAADAGVFVAASAGNRGPAAGTVGHPVPWVTTVGAAAARPRTATVRLGNGQRYTGTAATVPRLGPARLVLAREAAAPGADPGQAQQCAPGSLAVRLVAGAVVVCDRGGTARVAKATVVARADGAGMLLVNPTAGTLSADLHAVPTVHLADTAYDGLYAYAAGASSPTVRFVGTRVAPVTAVAPSSGRGPSAAAGGDLLKPDLVAPGSGVLGAAPVDRRGAARYVVRSGTSVAAAHVAGLALRLLSAHPDWSPSAVKSALMTTAGEVDGSAFAQGAGRVRPGRAADPGLVLEGDPTEWAGLLAGLAPRRPVRARPLRASNVNVASIAVAALAGRGSVTRTFTNVDDRTATYSVRKAGLSGISVVAFPSVFTLEPGEEQAVRLRIERDSAPLLRHETGYLRLTDSVGGHLVRLPVAVRPVGVHAPAELDLDDGRARVQVRSGVTGGLVARPRGLVAGVDTEATGTDTGGVDFRPGLDGVWTQTLEVAGPAELVRVEAVPGSGDDDLDLYLLDGGGTVVESAARRGSTEQLTTRGLDAGTYTVAVQPWFVAAPSGETDFTVRTFQVPRGPVGGLSLEPRRQRVAQGQDATWTAEADVEPDRAYLGWVGWYAGARTDDTRGDGPLGRTLVSVD